MSEKINDYFFSDESDESDNEKKIDTQIDDKDIKKECDVQIEEEETIVGIDLGTSNSCISIWKNQNLEIIPDHKGKRTTPSVVSFTNKSIYVGTEAKNQMELNSENTYYDSKRLIGRKFKDQHVQNELEYLSYGIKEDEKEGIVFTCGLSNRKDEYTPEEISAMILMKLKHQAENFLRKPIRKAVVTIPAYFNDSQRQATKDAIHIAGLEAVRILHEPTAAALAYGYEKATIKDGSNLVVLVYDLGGGTLDVSLLVIEKGMFQVIGSSGNTHLGGEDFDNRIYKYALREFKRKNNIQKLTNIQTISLQKLRKQCELAKRTLTTESRTVIAVKDF